MKAIVKCIGVLVIILLGIQVTSAAISVPSKSIVVNPSGDLVSGKTPVDATFVVSSPATGSGTTPKENLMFYTDLEDPKWTYSINKSGIKQDNGIPQNGPNFDISSWVLYYPKEDVSIYVTLSGTAPVVTSVTNKTIFRVGTESAAIASVQRMVINPASTSQGISEVKVTLAEFRSLIDQKSAAGVNVDEANAKYNEASNAIRTAEQAPNYAVAQQNLQKAQDLINQGKPLLDKASTQKLIKDAQVPIDQTDQLITYFKVNKSMKESDPKLALILTKRERAADLLTDAKDLVAQGKYYRCEHNRVNEASAKANEALNDALALKKEVGEGFNPIGGIASIFSGIAGAAMYIVIVIVAVVLVVIGVIFYKRRQRWDELG